MADNAIVLKGDDLTWEIIEANPDRYQVLKNGAVYDHEVKYIVKAPPIENQTFANQDKARAIAQERWRSYLYAAEDGAALAVKNTTHEAWRRIVWAQTGLALDVDRGRASTEAAKFVRSALDLEGSGKDDTKGNASALTFVVSENLARSIIDSFLLGNHDR